MYTSGDHICFKLTTQVPWNGQSTCKKLKVLNLLHHNTAGLYVAPFTGFRNYVCGVKQMFIMTWSYWPTFLYNSNNTISWQGHTILNVRFTPQTQNFWNLCSLVTVIDLVKQHSPPPPPPSPPLNSHPPSDSSKTFWRTYLFDCIYSITIENLHFNSFSVWWTQRAIGGNSQRKLELLLFARSGWCDILAGNRMTLFSTGHCCSS